MSAFDVTEGRRGVAQRVRPVDDRRELPGFNELLQNDQVLAEAINVSSEFLEFISMIDEKKIQIMNLHEVDHSEAAISR